MNTKVFKSSFSGVLLDWFKVEKRNLPFRDNKDPYKIWLSEIILQQTQMKTGVEYYKKFIKRFSSISMLHIMSKVENVRLQSSPRVCRCTFNH